VGSESGDVGFDLGMGPGFGQSPVLETEEHLLCFPGHDMEGRFATGSMRKWEWEWAVKTPKGLLVWVHINLYFPR
jgi:hypothetical protein